MDTPTWSPPRLEGTVALVTGASRGVGRGIARVLGECGATVHVTGRSSRAAGTTQDRAETIEDAADEVMARGGRGVAHRCDHTDEAQVRRLIEQIEAEEGQLDLLVNNAWGGYERTVEMRPFWEIPMAHWDGMFHGGLRTQFLTSHAAAPLLLARGRGLILNTCAYMGAKSHGNVPYDVVKNAVLRMSAAMAQDLRPHGVAVLALAPGWTRTERVLDHFGTTAESWREVPELSGTESVEYVGRAAAHLAADPDVLARSGRAYEAGALAREYGFRDVDGRQVVPFSEQHPELY